MMNSTKVGKKYILYLGSGVMSGVFSAGVLTVLQRENVYEKIEAIYGASAGAMKTPAPRARALRRNHRVSTPRAAQPVVEPVMRMGEV